METILKSDLDKKVKLNEVEVFTAEQVKQFAQSAYNEIQKSNGSKDALMKEVAEEIRSFKPIKVLDDVSRQNSIQFYRPAQIAWDSPIGDDISKSRSGTYLPTPENKKKGRVGRKYGEKKVEEDKSEDTLREECIKLAEKVDPDSVGYLKKAPFSALKMRIHGLRGAAESEKENAQPGSKAAEQNKEKHPEEKENTFSESKKRKARAMLSIHLAAAKDDKDEEAIKEITQARDKIMGAKNWGEASSILDQFGYAPEEIQKVIGLDPDED